MITHINRKINIVLVITIIALLVTLFPMSNVFAGSNMDQESPTDSMRERRVSLSRIWNFQKNQFVRLGKRLERTDKFITRLKEKIDIANQNGKDISAIQAALEVFMQANSDAIFIHQKGEVIIRTHAGFDEDGSVIDRSQAVESIESLADITRETRDARRDPFRLLREALRSFRVANPKSTPPAP